MLTSRIEIKKRTPLGFLQSTKRVVSANEAHIASAEQTSLVVVTYQRVDVIGTKCKLPGRLILGSILDKEKCVLIEAEVAFLVSEISDLEWLSIFRQTPETMPS